MGALTAHRQSAAMTQAAIAAEIHQPLDVDAGLATKIALDDIVAVDHFADLEHFGVAQLADAAIQRDLRLLHDLGRALLADAMDVLQRDQHALVGRNVHAGNTGHAVSPVADPPGIFGSEFLLSRAGPQTRTRRPTPRPFGARHRLITIRLGCGAY